MASDVKIYPGMKLEVEPHVLLNRDGCVQNKCMGKVIYINRRHKYYVVKIDTPGGSFKEAFKMKDPPPKQMDNKRGAYGYGRVF